MSRDANKLRKYSTKPVDGLSQYDATIIGLANIVDDRQSVSAHTPDIEDMPANWESKEYEKMLDYKSFLAGDEREL